MFGSPKVGATDPQSGRSFVPYLAALLVAVIAFITTGCGNAPASSTQAAQALQLSATFPTGSIGQAYNSVISVTGGSAPYSFSVRSGSMPEGLAINPGTGSVSGTPTTAGRYSFQVVVTDATQQSHGSRDFAIFVVRRIQTGLSISPASATITSAQKQQFTANVNGTANTGVTWTASMGSIDASGLYTAPSVTTQTAGVVTATSNDDATVHANANLTITAALVTTSPSITTVSLPSGQQ